MITIANVSIKHLTRAPMVLDTKRVCLC